MARRPSLSAPGADRPSLALPGAGRRLPAVDDHIAPPETRLEYLRGGEMYASPAHPPHATQHSRLAYLLEAHTARGYKAAVDLLIRTGESSDFAPDASIYPSGRDRKTGGRRMEVLAFEVSDQQSIGVPTAKARELAARGVERVFCILVKRSRVLEWSREHDGCSTMAQDMVIEHACLVRPLPISALIDAAAADDAVAQALLDRKVPVLQKALARERAAGKAEGRKQGKAEGKAEGRELGKAEGRELGVAEGRELGVAEGQELGRVAGLRESIRALLDARGVPITHSAAARIAACDEAEVLKQWLKRATSAVRAADVVKFEPRRRKRR